MSEMIERVARTLCIKDDPDLLVFPFSLPITSDGLLHAPLASPAIPLWQTKVRLAKSAIAAMREPTTAMVWRAYAGTAFASARRAEIEAGWRDMIDEALI